MSSHLEQADLTGKRVLLRVDWNVPLDSTGHVRDDARIQAVLPTLKLIRKKKTAQIILITHAGNPVVRAGESLEHTIAGNRSLQLQGVAAHVAELLDLPKKRLELTKLDGSPLPVYRIDEDLILMENLRFHPGEQLADRAFAHDLARLGDVFVSDAFPVLHRETASTIELPKLLPTYAGLQVLTEINHLNDFMRYTDRPRLVVLGGAKIYDKALVIRSLLKKVDAFLLGGVMANTFLAAQGINLRQSVVEEERFDLARHLLAQAPQKFILPIDFTWDRDRALDIGPQTSALFARHIQKAKAVFWNGPLGWTDAGKERFFHGSEAIAQAMATSSATTLVAGGDTLEVVDRYHLADKFSFCSTGGGATLAYLGGEHLPALDLLLKRDSLHRIK